MIICGLRKNIKKVNRNICRARKSKCKSKNRKEVIQMKKDKINAFIGRAVVYTAGYVTAVMFFIWACTRTVIY